MRGCSVVILIFLVVGVIFIIWIVSSNKESREIFLKLDAQSALFFEKINKNESVKLDVMFGDNFTRLYSPDKRLEWLDNFRQHIGDDLQIIEAKQWLLKKNASYPVFKIKYLCKSTKARYLIELKYVKYHDWKIDGVIVYDIPNSR